MAKLYYFNNLLNETTTVKDVGYNKIKKYAENDEIQKLLNGEKSSTFLTGEKLNCYKEKIEKNASFYMCSNAVFQIATELADIVENGKDVKNDNSFLNTVRKLVVTTYKNRINTEIKYVDLGFLHFATYKSYIWKEVLLDWERTEKQDNRCAKVLCKPFVSWIFKTF